MIYFFYGMVWHGTVCLYYVDLLPCKISDSSFKNDWVWNIWYWYVLFYFMVWYGIVWYFIVWHDIVWQGMVCWYYVDLLPCKISDYFGILMHSRIVSWYYLHQLWNPSLKNYWVMTVWIFGIWYVLVIYGKVWYHIEWHGMVCW